MGYVWDRLVRLGLARSKKWDRPTLLDSIFASPLAYLTSQVFALVLFLRGRPFQPPLGRPPVKVVCISDTHDRLVQVPDGDLLIHAGDLTSGGTAAAIQAQIDWLDAQPHTHKVFVCGNHDSWFDPAARNAEDRDQGRKPDLKSLVYLEHDSVSLEFHGGRRRLTIYGAPDIPMCGGADNALASPGST